MEATVILHSSLIIPYIDDIFYEIGLSLTSMRSHPRRRSHICHPIAICLSVWLYTIQRYYSLSVTNRHTLLILGDVGKFLGIQFHYNMTFILGSLFVISFQLIHLWNCYNHVQTSYMKLFQVNILQ